jgi:hypothetical protein
VARQHVRDGLALAQLRVQRVDRRARARRTPGETPSFSITRTAAITAFILPCFLLSCRWRWSSGGPRCESKSGITAIPGRNAIQAYSRAMDRITASPLHPHRRDRPVQQGAADLASPATATKAVARWRSAWARACCTHDARVTPPRSGALYYDKCKLIARELEEATAWPRCCRAASAARCAQHLGGLRPPRDGAARRCATCASTRRDAST